MVNILVMVTLMKPGFQAHESLVISKLITIRLHNNVGIKTVTLLVTKCNSPERNLKIHCEIDTLF